MRFYKLESSISTLLLAKIRRYNKLIFLSVKLIRVENDNNLVESLDAKYFKGEYSPIIFEICTPIHQQRNLLQVA